MTGTDQRGFVLLNALVLVAALAAVATFGVTRAASLRDGALTAQSAQQTRLYLDAMEAYAALLLQRDADRGRIDAAGDIWDRDDLTAPVDRGSVAGRIADLQARFDLNRLADPGDPYARPAFLRLSERIGLGAPVAQAIADFLVPGGPRDTAPYAALAVPQRPLGGRVLRMDDLLAIPSVDAATLSRLDRVATVLPQTAPLNVNTAPLDVLLSVLPDGAGRAVRNFVGNRAADTATDVETFRTMISDGLDDVERDALALVDLSVASDWFVLVATAQLDGHRASRRTVFHRTGTPASVATIHAIAIAP